MKKNLILISVLILFTALDVSAQHRHRRSHHHSNSEFRLGVTTGLGFSNMKMDDDEDFSAKAGFKIGVIAEYAFNEHFALSSGLVFNQRGFKEIFSGTFMGFEEQSTTKINLNYIQLPVNAVVRLPINNSLNIVGFAGPYFSYALSGKVTWEGTLTSGGITTTEDGERKLDIGFGEDDLNPFDIGLTIGAGLEVSSFFFRVQYEHGLRNLSNDNRYTTMNRNLGLSIGYFFSFR